MLDGRLEGGPRKTRNALPRRAVLKTLRVDSLIMEGEEEMVIGVNGILAGTIVEIPERYFREEFTRDDGEFILTLVREDGRRVGYIVLRTTSLTDSEIREINAGLKKIAKEAVRQLSKKKASDKTTSVISRRPSHS